MIVQPEVSVVPVTSPVVSCAQSQPSRLTSPLSVSIEQSESANEDIISPPKLNDLNCKLKDLSVKLPITGITTLTDYIKQDNNPSTPPPDSPNLFSESKFFFFFSFSQYFT